MFFIILLRWDVYSDFTNNYAHVEIYLRPNNNKVWSYSDGLRKDVSNPFLNIDPSKRDISILHLKWSNKNKELASEMRL